MSVKPFSIVKVAACSLLLINVSGSELNAANDDVTIEVWLNGESSDSAKKIFSGIVGDNNISIPTDELCVGSNLLTIRVLDEQNNVSTAYSRTFYVIDGSAFPKDNISAEWFFDEDLGVGTGNIVEAKAGENSIPIDVSGLEAGVHLLSFRCKVNDNTQSTTATRLIYVTDKLSMGVAEYFLDTDPGEGKGTQIEVGQDGMIPLEIPTSDLTIGQHMLTVREQVTENLWLPVWAGYINVTTPPSGTPSVELIKDFTVTRQGAAITLVSEDIEAGSKVRIVTTDCVVRNTTIWENTDQSLTVEVAPSLRDIIVVVESNKGERFVKRIK